MRDNDMNPGLGEVGRHLWELLKAASGEGLESGAPAKPQPQRRQLSQPKPFIVSRPQPTRVHEAADEPVLVTRQASASRRRREIQRMLRDRESLRNAILVSEILGPPKSLRRDESL